MYLDRAKKCLEKLNQLRRPSKSGQGCSLEEIQLLEKQIGLRFPNAYREFLLWIGNGGGCFSSDRATWQDARYGREDAIEIMQEAHLSAPHLPEDLIVFVSFHGGYRFAFILASEGDNPPVHEYLETPHGAHIVWNTSKSIDDYCVAEIEELIRFNLRHQPPAEL